VSRLAGKVAIVTGAGSGQGRAVALAYAAEGAGVLACDIAGEGAQETVRLCVEAGGRAVAATTDVSDQAQTSAAVTQAEEELGRLDVLYNNAGINPGSGGDGGVVDLDLEIWDRVLAVDLTGVMLMCRAAIPAMRRTGGGSIVNVSSVSAGLGGAGNAYTAAKGGALALTKAIAASYAPDIRCNAVCPGAIDTPMIEVTLADPAVRAKWEGRTLVGRIGVPEDIAPLAVYLGSDESAFVTGGVFVIDGGHSAH
jgi:NAD(P)-dependent dehydrogenase (short-subunit alcohol dehydrogenase family)